PLFDEFQALDLLAQPGLRHLIRRLCALEFSGGDDVGFVERRLTVEIRLEALDVGSCPLGRRLLSGDLLRSRSGEQLIQTGLRLAHRSFSLTDLFRSRSGD